MKETISIPGYKITTETITTYVADTVIPNQPPIVSAGLSQSITLPVSSITLQGSASDLDGSIQSSAWSKISGPSGAVFAEPNNLKTLVTGLIAGSYVFRLTATDDKGASVSKDTTVFVNAEIVTPPTGNPIPFTPSQLTTDFLRPGAGAEQWHGAWYVDVNNGVKGPDKYYRFQSWEFEKSKGVYDFSAFDTQASEAISRKGKFGFGLMTCFNGGDYNRRINYSDGTFSSYPAYLHSEFQASSQKDVLVGQCWVPPWNNPIYHDYLFRVHGAINAHIDTAVINGVRIKDTIKYIDIRGYGNYGEWHTSGIESAPQATAASLRKIIDAHIQGFPNHQLLAMIAALDGGSTNWDVFPKFTDISYYLLTAKNNVGEIGWRRDSLGATNQSDPYIAQILENNNKTYNGVALKSLIMDKWKRAPIHGERYGGTTMAILPTQVKLYHMCGFGNGDFIYPVSSADQAAVKEADKLAGYWLTITGGNITGNNITVTWQNNQCPVYEDFDVFFEFRNGSSVVSLPSKFKPKLFFGTASATDTFSSIPSGSLYVIIKDPKGYRTPLPLAISGKQADGSYLLKG
jgi:hypothetical protein